jgi:ribonuclease P protein component
VLAKKNRFHGYNSLNRVYKKGSTIRSPYCAIRYTTDARSDFKIAVVVSKKVTKAAPRRNRIRRRVYEAVRLLAPQYLKNENIVITVFDDRFLDMPHTELIETIEKQLKQIKNHSERAKL